MKVKNLFIFLILLIFSLTSCNLKPNVPYNEHIGYENYISDSNTGREGISYFNCDEAMESSEDAREYYKDNKRRRGSFIITDYEDGVCINRYVGRKLAEDEVLEIPEELDGKPVVKIGGYPQKVKEDYGEDGTLIHTEVFGAFAGNRDFILKLPSTVKIIGYNTFLYYSVMIAEVNRDEYTFVKNVIVSEDNPYYSSYEGALYSKDKKELLFDYRLGWMYYSSSYTVPDFVESFKPTNAVADGTSPESKRILNIGKNVKYIDTFIDMIEPGVNQVPNVIVRGYKGSAAEEWAEKENAEFEAIG